MLTITMYKGDLFNRTEDDNWLDFKVKNINAATQLIELALKNGYSIYIEKTEK